MTFLSSPRLPLGRMTVLLVLFAALACFAVTHGTMDWLGPEVRSRTFVDMWDHLRQGRFDVDPDVVGREAILVDGKTYAYWGPFPALLRGVIELFVARGDRDWGRASTLLAALIAAAAILVLLHERAERAIPIAADRRSLVFLLSIGWLFGSPLWVTMSSAFLYHEAILWALAWSMLFVVVYFEVERGGWTAPRGLLLGASAGFVLLSRVPCGVGPALVLGTTVSLVALGVWRFGAPPEPERGVGPGIAAAIVSYALLFAFALFVNYGRWGNALEFTPIENYVEHLRDPARAERFATFGAVNPRRIPTALRYYFVPERANLSRSFPFVAMPGWDPWKNGRGDSFAYMEPFNVALPVSAPFVVAMTALGLFAFVRRPSAVEGLLIGSFALQAGLLLSYMATAMRYQIDLLPLYFVLGLVALPSLATSRRTLAAATSVALAVLVVASVYCATITMLLYKSLLFAIPWETRVRIFTWIHTR